MIATSSTVPVFLSQLKLTEEVRHQIEKWTINFDDVFLGQELGRGAFGIVYR